jgi:hemoglobin
MISESVVSGTSVIDEPGLERLVAEFYARVRADDALGPIFNDAVEDWPEHLGKLAAFWSSVMTSSGRYKGQPVPAHMRHRARISPELFDRWLELWRQTTDELMAPVAAAALQAKANRIAESLQFALFFRLEDQVSSSDRTDIPVARPAISEA